MPEIHSTISPRLLVTTSPSCQGRGGGGAGLSSVNTSEPFIF